MSTLSPYSARSERVADRLAKTSCSTLILASTNHYGIVVGEYPVSGDMLAVKQRGKDSQATRRRRIMIKAIL